MTQPNPHWARKKEHGSYLGLKLLLLLYRYGGKWLILICLGPVLGYFFLKDRLARHASRQFLQQVHQYQGSRSPFASRPGYWLSYCHFWQFALAALAKIDAWLGRLNPEQVHYGGPLRFEQLLASGKGAVLIGSHLGNLEVCRALVRSRHPVKINVLMHTRNAAVFNRILKESNAEVDLELIEVSELTPAVGVMLSDCVDRGELVVIVGDRISAQVPGRAVWADFLGKPAPFATGPWILASLLQCPVYLMFCLREAGGYNLIFTPFADKLSFKRQQRTEQITALAQQYAQQLEQIACRYPLQWFNFYDFWQLPAASQHEEHPGDNSSTPAG